MNKTLMNKPIQLSFILSSCFTLTACNTETLSAITTSFVPKTSETKATVLDTTTDIHHCRIFKEKRIVECEITVKNLLSEKKIQTFNAVLEDDLGIQYSAVSPLLKPKSFKVDESYIYRIQASSINTRASKIVSLKQAFNVTRLDDEEIFPLNEQVQWISFTNIPMDTTEGQVLQEIYDPANNPKMLRPGKPLIADVIDGRWYVQLIASDGAPHYKDLDPWFKGVYLHTQKGGKLGYNWEYPRNYQYDSTNHWALKRGVLTLYFGDLAYQFNLVEPAYPLNSYFDLEQNYKLELHRTIKTQPQTALK